jgi:prevent-host-death family protein
MNKVHQIEPITHMQTKPTEVLSLLDAGPVILAQRSKPAAVLVSVAEWDSIADELARLTRIVAADKHFEEMRAGKYTTELP